MPFTCTSGKSPRPSKAASLLSLLSLKMRNGCGTVRKRRIHRDLRLRCTPGAAYWVRLFIPISREFTGECAKGKPLGSHFRGSWIRIPPRDIRLLNPERGFPGDPLGGLLRKMHESTQDCIWNLRLTSSGGLFPCELGNIRNVRSSRSGTSSLSASERRLSATMVCILFVS